MKNTPKMKGKDVFIPFSHMCKQWGMKDFTSLPEYVAHFTFPLYAFLEHRIIIESCVFIRKLYFYPWAVNTGKLIQYFWPPGGAHDTACSVSLLPSSLSEFLQKGTSSLSSAGAAIPLMLSVLPFDVGMHKIKLHLEKVKRTKPEGRWDNVTWADAGK